MLMNIPNHASILICRTDHIGDVILNIPVLKTIKEKFPKQRIIFLATSYTMPILKYIPYIDDILLYDEISKLSIDKQKEILQSHQVHTAIVFYPDKDVVKMLYAAKIPIRIATSHRWYTLLYCNKLVHFSRKNSDLHEAQLNFKLLKPLGIIHIPSFDDLVHYYSLKPIPSLSSSLSQYLDKNKFKVILHPKSRGSAREWGIDNYIQLIKKLDLSKFQVIITGTKHEAASLEKIFLECPDVCNMVGQTTLDELISLIHSCDAFVSASTGTLHIAAILGKHSIGLFPSIRPMHAGRWAPIGKHTYIYHLQKDCNLCKYKPEHCSCIQSISPDSIAQLLTNISTTINFSNHV